MGSLIQFLNQVMPFLFAILLFELIKLFLFAKPKHDMSQKRQNENKIKAGGIFIELMIAVLILYFVFSFLEVQFNL